MKRMKAMSKFLPALAAVTLLAACGNNGNGEADVAVDTNENGNGGENGASANSDDPITLAFFPNESGAEFTVIRDDMEDLITEATGRPAESMLTTDMNIAIEAIASGQADLAWMGPDGYIMAHDMNPNARAVMTASGPSGTLDDALFFSFIAVREEDKYDWKDENGEFSLDNLAEIETMSWVSATSTSGFNVPVEVVMDHFGEDDRDDFSMSGGFFDQVLFGNTHPGSAFNLVSGQAEAAAFLNLEDHFEFVGGEENRAGMIYQVRENAPAPLDTMAGERVVIIKSTPVPNGPFVANFDTLTEEEVNNIVDLFTSDEVAQNENFFGYRDSDQVSWRTRTEGGDERFIRTDDAWYDPLRNR